MPLKINLKSVVFYLLYAVCAVLLNAAASGVPLSLGLCFSLLLCGANLILTPAVYALASAVHLNLVISLFSLFEGVFLAFVTFIYRRYGKKIRFEGIIYVLAALAPYVAFCPWLAGNIFGVNAYALKAIAAACVAIFSFFCLKTVHSVVFRLMRARPREDELVCFAVVYAACGTGFYNLVGGFVYLVFACSATVFCARLFRSPSVVLCSLALSAPVCIEEFSLQPSTVYLIFGIAALLLCNAGRFAPSAACAVLCAGHAYFCGYFDRPAALIVFEAVAIAALCLAPALRGDKFYKKLYDSLACKSSLTDCAIARSRRLTGEKLFRISEVFREIECSFRALDEEFNDGSARGRMLAELKEKCCKNCDKAKKCERTSVYYGFKKLIDAGCVKGKVTLVDLPAETTANCTELTEVMSKLNLLLAEYRRYMTEAENARSGRKMLADQAQGIAEALKECAVGLCASVGEFTAAEKTVEKALASRGISCPEVRISDGGNEIYAIAFGKANAKAMCEIISKALKKPYALKEKIAEGGDKCCFVFASPPRYDAAFGVAHAVKNGEKVSGDTHSVIKINDKAFLMVLSDGMGSGEYARKVSATAISLIEAFYRAEMPEETVLNTINKLLSFNRDERFACIDIAAVNLDSGRADFIKIGSPAGVIVREGEIKVLESNSLPLGILDSLKPATCSETLRAGDIIVFMSDGVTSAFSSAPDIHEFLQGLKPLNPQSLADEVLAGALARVDGTVSDDMTVLCTRIFEHT